MFNRVAWRVIQAIAFVFLGLLALTCYSAVGSPESDNSVNRTGTAHVQRCTSAGPVTWSGFGYWWTCDADVSWQDGTSGHLRTSRSEFTAQDRAHPVDVREVIVPAKGGSHKSVVRADATYTYWGYVGAAVCVIPMLAILGSWIPKRWIRKQGEVS